MGWGVVRASLPGPRVRGTRGHRSLFPETQNGRRKAPAVCILSFWLVFPFVRFGPTRNDIQHNRSQSRIGHCELLRGAP